MSKQQITLDALNVIAVYCADIVKTQAFYEDLLGFEKVKDMSPGVLLYSKGADLTLYLEGGRSDRPSAEMKFPAVSVCFNAADGVAAATRILKQKEIPIVHTYGDFNSGFAGVQFLDPSGNIVEIAGKP